MTTEVTLEAELIQSSPLTIEESHKKLIIALEALLYATMYINHPIESQLAIDTLEQAKKVKL